MSQTEIGKGEAASGSPRGGAEARPYSRSAFPSVRPTNAARVALASQRPAARRERGSGHGNYDAVFSYHRFADANFANSPGSKAPLRCAGAMAGISSAFCWYVVAEQAVGELPTL